MDYHINNTKKALLSFREEILRDLKYFEKRIEDARSQKTNSIYYTDDDDSDSDNVYSLDMRPSVSELKSEESRLQTCLHATQELTGLIVLQSEVNIILNDPVYERGPPVTEPGTWREVTADCRLDLVPFSITFFTHQHSREYGPISYRGLQVLPVKAAHENELAKSILSQVDTPSDAMEVLRSYAVAHRSRRTTLARLAEKYSNSLFMEPMANGGYILKCAKLLEVCWTLENKWSPIAAFLHKMKFDLEYMDEAYVKIISQAHRELSKPTLETDERTRLMSKIIATCLEAQGPSQELYESMESDIESDNLRKRSTSLEEGIEEPVNKKKKDSEMMAPPKNLPKKTKPKGKENNVFNKNDPKPVKRSMIDEGDSGVKKPKRSRDNAVKNNENNRNKDDNVRENIACKKNGENNVTKSKSVEEKVVGNTKSSRQGIAEKHSAVKEAVVIPKKAADNASKAKTNVGSSKSTEKLGSAQNSDVRLKNATDKSKITSNLDTFKNNVDKQNLKGKSKNDKKSADKEISDKIVNAKKFNKLPDNVPNNDMEEDSNKINNQAKLKKFPKIVEQYNSGGSKKITSTKGQNVENVSENNNENPRKTKVSNSQPRAANKDENLNTIDKISSKKIYVKAKPHDNETENVPSINNDTVTVNKSNEKVINTKSKAVKPKSKSKENLNENVIKTKPNINNNRKETALEDDNLNKQIADREINNKNARPNLNTEKAVKKHDLGKIITNSKQNNAQLKVAKDVNAKSKNIDKVIEKNGKRNNMKEPNNVANIKMVDTNLDNVYKKIGTDSNKLNAVDIHENAGRNSVNKKYNTNKQVIDRNDNNAKYKFLKSNLNIKNHAQSIIKNVTNSKNLRSSKSPIQKNKIELLNPRIKMSIDKLKLTNNKQKEKDNSDKNKKDTKIPQKLMTVREQIIKKNPLRISPRKMQTNLKIDSLNSSRSSLRSLQKPMTGIPRLMKKPVFK